MMPYPSITKYVLSYYTVAGESICIESESRHTRASKIAWSVGASLSTIVKTFSTLIDVWLN